MTDDDKQLLALLDKKIAYHREQFEHHRTEMDRHRLDLERYESSAASLRGEITETQRNPRQKQTRPRAKVGTAEAVQRLLDRVAPLTISEITDELLASGWETTSADPVNNVRTQVSRMVKSERVRKNPDGRYELMA